MFCGGGHLGFLIITKPQFVMDHSKIIHSIFNFKLLSSFWTTDLLWSVNQIVLVHASMFNFRYAQASHILMRFTKGTYLQSFFSILTIISKTRGQLWSCGSWIYNNLCCEIESSSDKVCTTLCDKVYQWLAAGQWFSPDTLVSSTNKTDHHDITEISC